MSARDKSTCARALQLGGMGHVGGCCEVTVTRRHVTWRRVTRAHDIETRDGDKEARDKDARDKSA
jgi:hypothetical protein